MERPANINHWQLSRRGPFRNTVSADQLMAEVQGTATRFQSLEMAIEGVSLTWSRDVIQRRLSRRGSILDLVANDAKRVNKKLGSQDRNKLDEYLTAVPQVEERPFR